MITENLSTLKIHKLTQAQYERELAAGRLDENALYLTPDDDTKTSDLPTVTSVDTGKFLRVSPEGKWIAESLQKAEEVAY